MTGHISSINSHLGSNVHLSRIGAVLRANMLHLLLEGVPALAFPNWLPMDEIMNLLCTHKTVNELMQDIKSCIRFVRCLQVRDQYSFSAKMWNDVRKDCEEATTLEGWHVDVWQRACVQFWNDRPYRLPETFFLLLDALVRRHLSAYNMHNPSDTCVAVLAFEGDREPGQADNGFFVQCLFLLASTRICILGAIACDEDPVWRTEDIVYNMILGDSVRRVIQTATEVIARKRRPRGPQDDESPLMPWAMLDGRVCIYFCDQDMRLSREDGGNSTTVANPFMVCNVERFQSLMQQIHDGIAP
jgi:hypothetical protein